MKVRATTSILRVAMLIGFLHGALLMALPTPDQAGTVSKAELEQVRSALDGIADVSGKAEFLQRTLTQTTNSATRKELLKMAEVFGGDELERLLIGVVEGDSDVEVRIIAVKLLGRKGTTKSIQPLLHCAQNDPTGTFQRGCVVGETNARRDAYFALAELGLRFPSERERLAKAVREMPGIPDRDTQTTVLYILTNDESLLRPFYERMASPDPRTRVSGVTAFRLLKLKRAPKQIVQLIHDPEPEVRNWVALVLGEIGDPETVGLLMDAAGNKTMDRGTRCNAIYSLGRMRAAKAKVLLQQLLLDEDVKVNAAISLSQITGERHPLVPQGYHLD